MILRRLTLWLETSLLLAVHLSFAMKSERAAIADRTYARLDHVSYFITSANCKFRRVDHWLLPRNRLHLLVRASLCMYLLILIMICRGVRGGVPPVMPEVCCLPLCPGRHLHKRSQFSFVIGAFVFFYYFLFYFFAVFNKTLYCKTHHENVAQTNIDTTKGS